MAVVLASESSEKIAWALKVAKATEDFVAAEKAAQAARTRLNAVLKAKP